MSRAFNAIAVLAVLTLIVSQVPAKNPTTDKIVIYKEKREMVLLAKGQVIRTYRISLGANPKGPKTQQGDHKTPEGDYVISGRNPSSHFHRALRISYPSQRDRENAARMGVDPGGDIMIHGLPNGLGWLGRTHLLYDWTDGCIAVTNQEIEEIWNLVPDGTPVEIKP